MLKIVCREARSLKKQWSEVWLCGKESEGGEEREPFLFPFFSDTPFSFFCLSTSRFSRLVVRVCLLSFLGATVI